MKKISIIALVLLAGVSLVVYMSSKAIPDISSQFVIKKIQSEDGSKTLYLKNEKRGLNYSVSTVSTSSEEVSFDQEKEYVFSVGEASFYYKFEQDTLFIHTYHLGSVPTSFESDATIKQIEYNNYLHKRYKEGYKEMGLSKFPEE